MNVALAKPEHLVRLCDEADIAEGLNALDEALNTLMPGLEFRHTMTRGNWHRLGGVIDAGYQPISDNIVHWAETESNGDVESLMAKYMDQGYFATRLAGKTHYFTAAIGEKAKDFIQLEIEELQEVLDRPLVDRDWFPDSLEEFLDPLDYPRLEPEPIGAAYFRYRRVTNIKELMDSAANTGQAPFALHRFFQDWHKSSAYDAEPFCHHWVLALQEYLDSDGQRRMNARPISSSSDQLPELPPGETLHGTELANAIHGYDRAMGYPFAWYFIMLSTRSANYELAKAVLRDQVGAYDYLPARDLKVLRSWAERPYSV